MTQINKSYEQGQQKALAELGMEKEAFLGSLKLGLNALKSGGHRLLGQGAKAGNSLANAFKGGAKTSNFGLKTMKGSRKSIDRLAVNSQNLRQQGALRNKAVQVQQNRASGQGAASLRHKKPAVTLPKPAVASSGPLSNAPGTRPFVPAKSAGSQANMGNTKVPTMPQAQYQSPIGPAQKGGFNTPQPAAAVAGPKLPPTSQEKALEWAKANPVLAGAGGLMGYKTLNNNGGGTTVVR